MGITREDNMGEIQTTTGAPASVLQWLNAESTVQSIASAVPAGTDAARFKRALMTAARKVPDLAKCEPGSFAACALDCASMGLMPGPLKHVHLIPRKNRRANRIDCTLVVGYEGLLELMRRHPDVSSAYVGVARKHDHLEIWESPPKLEHRINLDADDRGDVVRYYAVVLLHSSPLPIFHHMSVTEVLAHRDKYAPRYNGDITGPFADLDHLDSYGLKTCVRMLSKYAPKSDGLAHAIEAEEREPVTTIDVTPTAQASPDVDPFAPKALDNNPSPPAPTAEEAPEREAAVVDRDAPFTDDEIGGGR